MGKTQLRLARLEVKYQLEVDALALDELQCLVRIPAALHDEL